MNIPLLRCQNVSKTFQNGRKMLTVFNNINFPLYPDETVLLFGRSGQGKSVLLSLLCGLDVPTTGDIYFDGVWFQSGSWRQFEALRRNQIGIIFQNLNLMPSWTAIENVEAALEDIISSSRTRRTLAQALLEEMELADRLNHLPEELSLGEQQRVAIARTLIREPKLLLADEPTGDLDMETSAQIVRILRSYIQRKNATLFVASHGNFPDMHFDRTLILHHGTISEGSDMLAQEILSFKQSTDPYSLVSLSAP